jgi:hypothetical protein
MAQLAELCASVDAITHPLGTGRRERHADVIAAVMEKSPRRRHTMMATGKRPAADALGAIRHHLS